MSKSNANVSVLSQAKTFTALTFNRTFKKGRWFAVVLVLAFGLAMFNFWLASLNGGGSSTDTATVVADQQNVLGNGVSQISPILINSTSFRHFYDQSLLSAQDQQKLAPIWKSIKAVPVPFGLLNSTSTVLSGFTENDAPQGSIAFVFQSPTNYKIKHVSFFGVNNLFYCISNSHLCNYPSNDLQKIAIIKYQVDQALSSTTSPIVSFSRAKSNGTSSSKSKLPINFFFSLFFIALGGPYVSAMLEDKNKGLKFGLFMTGLHRAAYYIGLFSVPVLITIVYCLIIVILTIGSTSSALIPLLILTLCSGFAYLGVFWIVSQLVSTERNANIFILIYSIIGLLGCTQLMNDMLVTLPSFILLILCINPVFGYGAFLTIANFSPYGAGFSNQSVPFGAPSVNQFVLVSIVFTLLTIFLAWYLDWLQISQDTRLSIFYPIQKLFRMSRKGGEELTEEKGVTPMIEQSGIENVPETEKVSISNLSKQYEGASTFALREVSLEFAKGEIFGLLGYNGAGKSTMINILCGILSPSSGSIRVFGKDPLTNRQEIAIRTGICQQQDILFDKLTARDHLYYFGVMRGVPRSKIESVIQEIKHDLQIDESMLNSPSSVLSGGQKRKLCVALAYVKDPELVILDEMSSGVDPENRRVIWDFLIRKREGRATLLCTHFMDEADLVTGRKAMLTLGKLVCLGSSEFLKHSYDTGYTLVIETTPEFDHTWFREHQAQCQCTKTGERLVEYIFRAQQIGFLAVFEADKALKKMYTNYSIKENGLQEIFSSTKLVNESELRISPQHQEKILGHFQQFKDPSMCAKTYYLLKFEFKRALSSLSQLLIRLIITTIVTGLCCYFMSSFNSTNVGSNVDIPVDNSFYDKFIPQGLFFTTNMASLISLDSSKFSSVNNGVLGSIMQQPNGAINVVLSEGFAGVGFLAVKSLITSVESGIQSTYEFVPEKLDISINIGTLPVIMVTFAEALIYLGVIMVDEAAESREQLKFLLLSFGIPLISYWAILLLKLFIITLPFLIALVASVPANFILFDPVFVVVMMLMMIIFSAFLGSALPINTARGIIKGFQYGMVGFMVIVPIIVFSAKLPLSTLGSFGTACYFIAPFVPIAPFFQLLSSNGSPSKTALVVAALGNLVIFSILLIYVEMRHLLIKNVRASEKSAYVQFTNVRKSFTSGLFRRTTKVAVNDLNLGINKNELFALLGPNGCGKTTSLSMLTAQQLPDKGFIHLDNIHVASKKLEAIRKIGYCPQFDDLLVASMTVSEHLILFCTMNGISPEVRDEYIDLLLHAFGIERFYSVKCGALSGGTKRKVSAALAVMLPRSLVVLDEASTGLDPLARLKLWNTVKLLNRDRTTIMTTHYINETSACDRIAIMTSGKLQCCDTEHELSKRAEGYQLTVRIPSQVSPPAFLNLAAARLFHDDREARMVIESVVGDIIVFHLTKFQTPMGQLVNRLIEMHQGGLLLDFQLGRMNLEHVFLQVAKAASGQQKPGLAA